MQSLTGRCCVFCGSPADSREHVFAKRLCKRAGADRFLVIPGVSSQTKGTTTRRQHLLEGLQVRHVCAKCNNTWMNDLESWFERRLGFLIEPDWPRLAVPMIEGLKPECEHVARWLMKSAVMFNLSSVKGDLPVQFPSEVTRRIKDGILPNHCWVDLAYSKLSTIGGLISRSFQVINGGKYNPGQVFTQGVGFRFTVQFNHLLLRIARAPGANVTYQSWQGELPARLYPAAPRKLPDNFTYGDLRKFEDAVVLETWPNCLGNVA